MENTAEPLASSAPNAGYPLTDQPKLRFVVGTFDSWPQVRDALSDLRVRGLILDSFNCLALRRQFSGKIIQAPDQTSVSVEALPFASGPMACTSGPLADCLRERIDSGAQSLKEALARWLIPRHAAYFQDAVHARKIVFWIKVTDADQERRAYQTLLVHSSNSVGVHDLVLPGEY